MIALAQKYARTSYQIVYGMLAFLRSTSSVTRGNNQLTMVPEDLPPISYRHSFVVIGRPTVYTQFVKMVCESQSARFAICRRSNSVVGGENSVYNTSRSSMSLTSNSSLNLRRSTRRSGQRRESGNKCYCQIEAPSIPHLTSVGRSQTGSLSQSQSPEMRDAASNESTPICASVSGSVSRQRTLLSAIVTRVSFDNVSYKYSSSIPRLTSMTAVLNTAFIFLLSLDPPPSPSKVATASNPCMKCWKCLIGEDSSNRSEWNTLKEDIAMLELRLRQCQRTLENCGKRFGKPFVCLLVLSGVQSASGRRPSTRQQERRLAVDDLWRMWGPSGKGVLADRYDYEWNGDKLHGLACDISERLARQWRSSSIAVL